MNEAKRIAQIAFSLGIGANEYRKPREFKLGMLEVLKIREAQLFNHFAVSFFIRLYFLKKPSFCLPCCQSVA